MAYSWQSVSPADITTSDSLTSTRTRIGYLKNDLLYLRDVFGTDANQLPVSNTTAPSGSVTSDNVISVVQTLNALEVTQVCTSYNSTQFSSVCSSLYGNYDTHHGAQKSAENSNKSDNGNYSADDKHNSSHNSTHWIF